MKCQNHVADSECQCVHKSCSLFLNGTKSVFVFANISLPEQSQVDVGGPDIVIGFLYTLAPSGVWCI